MVKCSLRQYFNLSSNTLALFMQTITDIYGLSPAELVTLSCFSSFISIADNRHCYFPNDDSRLSKVEFLR